MRAVLIEEFGRQPSVTTVPDPEPAADAVVVKVVASGLCRSDWHGWLGHDRDIVLPHVPGHEFAGTVAALGAGVSGWAVGDRVTAPFVCACGRCAQCRLGQHQVCLNQQQPGFTYWGSFAEYVAVPNAELNLVALPEALSFDAAAGLGCRFATAYRAVRQVAEVGAEEWVAVFGCGGVGLSAVMIAAAAGARVIAVDTEAAALALATTVGAHHAITTGADVVEQIRDLSDGGVHVTIDALGSAAIIQAALAALRPRGRHVQVGLLPQTIAVDLGALVGRELQWLGSHGLGAPDYPQLLAEVDRGVLRPGELLGHVIDLDHAPAALAAMSVASPLGVTIIRPGIAS